MSELFPVFLPTCSCFGWELCFPGWQPGRKSTNNSSGGQHRHPPGVGKSSACGSQWLCNPCPWLLLHLCEHHTAFLGTRGPSVSHRWCLEPAVSLWWQSSALGCCWALAEQLGRGACSTVCIWIFCRHPQDYQAQARAAQVAHGQDP